MKGIPGAERGNPSVNGVSESGLYKLVMRSDKPEAKAFQKWVTRTVLPAIRRDGGYVAGENGGDVTEVSDGQSHRAAAP